MIPVAQARALVTQGLAPLHTEAIELTQALGRVCAHDLIANRSLPAFDNSAMDGYAIRSADLGAAELTVSMTVAAGAMPTEPLGPGQAARIFTGAPIPEGADTVVMQENVARTGDLIAIEAAPKAGQNVRRAGEDIARGAVLAQLGTPLDPGLIAVLAAQGYGRVEVFRRPKVAILPNGDELVPIGVEPGPGQIPNSNAVMLAAQVQMAGGEPWIFPPIPDERAAISAALREASRHADVILTTGGMSVGDFDYTRDALAVDAELSFYKVRVKPGKPLGLGAIDGTPVLGLPGNPVSAFVGFELFARPMVRTLGGHHTVDHPQFQAPLAAAVRPNRTRPEYMRCDLVDGQLVPWPKQGSSMLSSLLHADALAIIEAGTETLPAQTIVTAVRLRSGVGSPG